MSRTRHDPFSYPPFSHWFAIWRETTELPRPTPLRPRFLHPPAWIPSENFDCQHLSPPPRNNLKPDFSSFLFPRARYDAVYLYASYQDSGTKIGEITFVRGFLLPRFFNRAKNFHHEESKKEVSLLFFFQTFSPKNASPKVSLPPPFFPIRKWLVGRFAEGPRIFQARLFTVA